MKTGDCVAFSGKGLFSDVIRWRSSSQISHVGKIIVMPSGRLAEDAALEDRVMVCESTTSITLPDAVYGKDVIKGVQMHYLSQHVLSYQGEIWWHPLLEPLNPVQTDKMIAWLTSRHVKRVKYDMAQALGAGLDLWDSLGFVNSNDFSKLFCSEMCSKADVESGILLKNYPCSEVMPSEYVKKSGLYGAGVKIL